jgi:hypothetical protein
VRQVRDVEHEPRERLLRLRDDLLGPRDAVAERARLGDGLLALRRVLHVADAVRRLRALRAERFDRLDRLAARPVGLEHLVHLRRRHAHLGQLGLHVVGFGADEADVEHGPSAYQIERAAHVFHGRRVDVQPDADDVEPRRPLVPATRRQEVARHPPDLRLLPAVDGFERGPEPAARAGAHLDEHDRVAVERDDVDLAGAAAEVPHDHAPAEARHERRRHVLAAPARLPPPVHRARP